MTYLRHFGILGQKWGIRRYQNEDGTLTEEGKIRYEKQMSDAASKDAKRYVDAKMYYGEGAGTRRKLLKAELSKKMKDQTYKKYFDEYVKNGNYVGAARRAKLERGTRDTGKKIKRAVRTVAPIAAAVGGIYYAANRDKVNRAVLNGIGRVKEAYKNYKTRRWFKKFMRGVRP